MILALHQTITPYKMIALFTCLGGVILVAVDNWNVAESGRTGMLCLLLSLGMPVGAL